MKYSIPVALFFLADIYRSTTGTMLRLILLKWYASCCGRREDDNMGQLKLAPDAFSGAAFHCYSGTVSDQTAFHDIFPNKVVTLFKIRTLLTLYRKYTSLNALEYLGLSGGMMSR
jgi:hypothetical protein